MVINLVSKAVWRKPLFDDDVFAGLDVSDPLASVPDDVWMEVFPHDWEFVAKVARQMVRRLKLKPVDAVRRANEYAVMESMMDVPEIANALDALVPLFPEPMGPDDLPASHVGAAASAASETAKRHWREILEAKPLKPGRDGQIDAAWKMRCWHMKDRCLVCGRRHEGRKVLKQGDDIIHADGMCGQAFPSIARKFCGLVVEMSKMHRERDYRVHEGGWGIFDPSDWAGGSAA